MYNPDTEIIFPLRVTSQLIDARGDEWNRLVELIQSSGQDSVESAAFVYMMAKLCGCAGCNADSFRAMRGCTACAKQSVRRYRSTDDELVNHFYSMLEEYRLLVKKQGPSGPE